MELSAITAVTLPPDRSASAKGKASSESAPFADSLQRATAGNIAQPAAQNGTTAAKAPNSDANGQTSSEPANAVAAQPPATDSAEDGTGLSGAPAAPALQALDEEDMSSLRAILASLSPAADDPSGTQAVGGESSSLDADSLAAMVAGLPLAMVSQPPNAASGTGASAGPALSNVGQRALTQQILKATATAPPADGAAALETSPAEIDQAGTPERAKAPASQSGFGGLLSAIDSRRSDGTTPGANSGMTAMNGQTPVLPGAPDSAAVTAASQIGDAASISLPERNASDVSSVPTPRSDIGSLATATTSPTGAAGPASAGSSTPGFINAPVQSPQWPASFGQQVLQMHQRGDQQMSLRLHPQELGPLNVSLTVQDQQAQLQILSAHAPVRAAVEAAIPQLRQALADSGIALGEAMVSDQGHFQQGHSSGDDRPRHGGGTAGSLLTATGIEPVDDVTARSITLTGNGNINLYA
ncbi:flagellar hook-length control protein FliK [Salinicola sp. CR57]|uniref:flagellar hook-length control protein FliK n=1 Tax=Salinicola sp. CR57 TaxID=1949086 RepID=UPI000DA1A387|nr:flagellar hook-length control protein FliK [Salinicola sp. CR57]